MKKSSNKQYVLFILRCIAFELTLVILKLESWKMAHMLILVMCLVILDVTWIQSGVDAQLLVTVNLKSNNILKRPVLFKPMNN